MPFNRPPRIQSPVPSDKVKIPTLNSPPQKPSKTNWFTIAFPVLGLIISITLMVTKSEGGIGSYLMFIPVMAASYLATFATSFFQKRKYKADVETAKQEYRKKLRDTETLLHKYHKDQKRISLAVNPALDLCLERAQNTDPRLGERRVTDTDFLAPRLGLGEAPISIELEPIDDDLKLEDFEKELAFARKMFSAYSTVPNTPITARLEHTGSIGFSGQRNEVLKSARAFICHIATHHWPGEVHFGHISSKDHAHDWGWLELLPHHTNSLSIPSGGDAVAQKMDALEVELQSREQFVETQKEINKEREADRPLPRLLIIFDYLPSEYKHPALSKLLSQGAELGIFGLFLMSKPEDVPGQCGATINVTSNLVEYKEIGLSGQKSTCTPDKLGLTAAKKFATELAKIEWPSESDGAAPPTLITFLEMFGAKSVHELPIAEWWDKGSPFGYLRAPIGRLSATSDLIFDFNDHDGAHGPHGLIGGMTGSGKSEVLKSILLAFAATHHPYDLNFALIDYKGGAAFNELAMLPHTVGVVTNIEENASFAERVIHALSGEIERREHILENARSAFKFGRSHINDYRKLPVKQPLPHLIIVFDEFAEFKTRHPEESKRLISIARKGRSLGVHLVLATQNIESAVDPEIMQNSSFKICLKVSEVQDSMQMIGIPDAVNLIRGRAYLSTNSRQLFQVAYAGAEYQDAAQSVLKLKKIWPDGRTQTIQPSSTAHAPMTYSQTLAVIHHINAVFEQEELKSPPNVWPDALPGKLYLPGILQQYTMGGWDGQTWNPSQLRVKPDKSSSAIIPPIVGVYDLPAKQKQIIYSLDPKKSGNVLIFGSSGSGKSVTLRTIVTSLAITSSPDNVQIQILDLGGQSTLKPLETFPHVGTVATRLDQERVERLIQHFLHQVIKRNDLLFEAKVDNWVDYNNQVEAGKKLPALYLIIDNFRELKRSYNNELVDELSGLLSGAAATGIFVVIATNNPNDLPGDIFTNVTERITFNQAEDTEYYRIVGRPSELVIEEMIAKGTQPGRGFLRGNPPLDFQAALPTLGTNDNQQTQELIELAQAMKKAWDGPIPQRIESLPFHIPIPKQLPISQQSLEGKPQAIIGQDYNTMNFVNVSLTEDGPFFLVGGVSPQTGKTTLLQTMLINLARLNSQEDIKIILVDFHRRSLSDFRKVPHVHKYIGIKSELEEILDELRNLVDTREEQIDEAYRQNPDTFDQNEIIQSWPKYIFVIDDYDDFARKADYLSKDLGDILTKGANLGLITIIAGNINELPRDFEDPLMQSMRRQGCGVLLSGSEGIDQYNNARRPAGLPPAGLPPGRGLLVKRGSAALFQVFAPWKENEVPEHALQSWLKKLAN